MKANPIKSCPGCIDSEKRKAVPFAGQCSACRKKERNRLWRDQNPGAMAANAKKWRDAGNKSERPEGYAEAQRQRHAAKYASDADYRERAKGYARKRRAEKPETVKLELKAWTAKNRDRVRSYARDYQSTRRSEDPVFHQRCLDLQSMWRIRKWAKDPQSDSWIRHVENQSILPAWRARLRIWQDKRCYVCNAVSDRLTIEHLVPRSRGGPTVTQNITYSCRSCNFSRQHRIWGPEWNPAAVEPAYDGFMVRYLTISAALKDAGLGGRLDSDGGFILESGHRPPRKLYVLSTFSCSERNPGSLGGRFASALRAAETTSVIVFDSEWYSRQAAIINMLRSKMGIAERRIGARSLSVVSVAPAAAAEFLRSRHAMGSVDGSFRVGLTDGSRLAGVGVFADRGDVYECVRLAFDGHVAGGMSRIMTGLWRAHGRKPISSYVDTRYADGAGHESIGFTSQGRTPESYLWVFPDRMQHQRYLSNDNKMSRNLIWFDPLLSREENIKANGIFRVWIPGRSRFLLPC